MKPSSLLLLGLLLIAVIGQAAPTPTDSLKIQQAQTARRLDSISASLQKLSRTNDSLNKELTYFRAKEDFYAMAVDRQGSHFEWLLGIALAIAGLFTYGSFKTEINKARKEAKEQVSESKAQTLRLKTDYGRLKHRIYSSMSLLFHNLVGYNPPDTSIFESVDIALNMAVISLQYAADAYLLQEEGVNINTLRQIDITSKIIASIDHTNISLSHIDTILSSCDPDQKNAYIEILREKYSEVGSILNKLPHNEDSFGLLAIQLKQRFRELLR
jgi:hypothetical protein